MSEAIMLLVNVVANDIAYCRAAKQPFIGLMRPLDAEGVSWDYEDVRLSELTAEENKYDAATGTWRMRCEFHDDDWCQAEHNKLTRFLEELSSDGGTGVVFACAEYMPCLVWHLSRGSVRHDELDPEQFPANVRKLLAAEAWHAAADAMLKWCNARD